jgi:hypothetical protein
VCSRRTTPIFEYLDIHVATLQSRQNGLLQHHSTLVLRQDFGLDSSMA